jgi:phosphoglycolate phosphatase
MLVVFDLDGTLIDSTTVLLKAHDAAWASVGRPRPGDEEILAMIGLPLVDIMATLAPDLDPVPLIQEYSRAYREAALHDERLFDGVKELLSRPYRAAVATGKGQNGAERAVARNGLQGRFEVVVGGSTARRPKPHPDMLHHIMDVTGTRDLIMVGDTTFDLEMARDAGVPAIGVSWGHHPVERLAPLAPIVTTMAQLDRKLRAALEV